MKQNNFAKKRIIHLYVLLFIILMIISVACFFIIKYSVEGEKNLPFNLKKINVISTAESDIVQDGEKEWHAGMLQENNIFIVLEKNDSYKKEDTIKKIKIENFKIEKENEKMQINFYKPRSNEFEYKYLDEYKIADSIEFDGALNTDLENLQVNNQGCTIGFSVTAGNLGEYNFSVNEKVPSDGKLLALAGLSEQDIKFNISFDLIIETGNGNTFKTNIKLNLPAGNILKDGVCTYEDTEFEDVVFKRVK